jgi:hypothetical protein
VGSFCIRPVYMGCAPCAFNNIDILPIKKKNKGRGEIENSQAIVHMEIEKYVHVYNIYAELYQKAHGSYFI